MKRPEIKIAIPEVLKVQLVDDWEAITKNQQVCRLVFIVLDAYFLTRCRTAGTYSSDSQCRPDSPDVQSPRCRDSTRSYSVRRTSISHFRSQLTLATVSRLTEEVVAGLRLYFNKCLGNNLLYRFERGQYSDHYKTLEETQEVSSLYGAEHLLRLFVNLPELIAHTVMDGETVAVLKANVTDFLRFAISFSHYRVGYSLAC